MEIRMSQLTGEEVSVKSYDTVVRVVVPLSTADGARVLCAAAQPSVSLSEAAFRADPCGGKRKMLCDQRIRRAAVYERERRFVV